MMNALVLSNLRARNEGDVFKGTGSEPITPEGAREVLNAPLWSSNELMIKASIVELQRAGSLREENTARFATKLSLILPTTTGRAYRNSQSHWQTI